MPLSKAAPKHIILKSSTPLAGLQFPWHLSASPVPYVAAVAFANKWIKTLGWPQQWAQLNTTVLRRYQVLSPPQLNTMPWVTRDSLAAQLLRESVQKNTTTGPSPLDTVLHWVCVLEMLQQ